MFLSVAISTQRNTLSYLFLDEIEKVTTMSHLTYLIFLISKMMKIDANRIRFAAPSAAKGFFILLVLFPNV